MPRKPLRECQDRDPKFRRQKRHGRRDTAFVELDGRRISLGPYDDPATRQAYYRVLAEWRAGRSPTPATIRPAAAAEAYTVGDLCDAYEPHARRRYVDEAGEPTDTRFLAASAMDALRRYEAGTPVDAFGPRALKRLRDEWSSGRISFVQAREAAEAAGKEWPEDAEPSPLSITTVRRYVGAVRRIFKFGVGEELVQPSTLAALEAVGCDRRDLPAARPPRDVRPVPLEHIDAIRPHVPPVLWTLIRVHLHCGARPGELVGLRVGDIDRSSEPWIVRLGDHKNAHRGHERTLAFGPASRRILEPLLDGRDPGDPVFDAREAYTAQRGTPPPSTVGECYTPDSYRRAVERACRKAEVPVWTPNRLRHNHATAIRATEHGLEGARVVLGHRHAAITEVYAERDYGKLLEIQEALG